ncbi:MAG TPA: hypothetical protein VG367_15900 [Mucilaginibacter sp.]|jgi:hypothetical protein|nr:hypothetical protein [Mucilaginibacter sp.]
MKTLKLFMIAVALTLFSISACKKDSTSATTTVTTDDAADIAAGALAENSGGLTSVTDNIATNADAVVGSVNGKTVNSVGTASIHQECGTTLADSASNAGSADSVSWSYSVKYSRTLNCNTSNQPDNLIDSLVYDGSYHGPVVTSTNSGSAKVTIAGLTHQATNYVVNGDYHRTGSFDNKSSGKSYNSKIAITATNVLLSKPGHKIVGGSATFTISGSTPKGTYSYSGTITFNADSSATLNITGGGSYTIDLRTGFRTRRK